MDNNSANSLRLAINHLNKFIDNAKNDQTKNLTAEQKKEYEKQADARGLNKAIEDLKNAMNILNKK